MLDDAQAEASRHEQVTALALALRLSGLPEDARRWRLLVPFQTYVDDSGGLGHSKHFVLAGLIGHSEDWTVFSDEWRACLAEKPSIKRFKMSEAARRSGEFYRWTAEMRDAKLRSLTRIINRHAQVLTYSVIDLAAHQETWAKRLPKPLNEAYFHPFQNTIMATCFLLWDNGHREPFEIIFDEQEVFGLRAKAYYPAFRAMMEYKEPEAATLLPPEPWFRSDDQALPLQAADLAAWCIRKCTDDPAYDQFNWLLAELRSVKQTDYSQYYDRDRMEAVWGQAEDLLKTGNIPPDLLTAFRTVRGS